jgi:hypothetical protein
MRVIPPKCANFAFDGLLSCDFRSRSASVSENATNVRDDAARAGRAVRNTAIQAANAQSEIALLRIDGPLCCRRSHPVDAGVFETKWNENTPMTAIQPSPTHINFHPARSTRERLRSHAVPESAVKALVCGIPGHLIRISRVCGHQVMYRVEGPDGLKTQIGRP